MWREGTLLGRLPATTRAGLLGLGVAKDYDTGDVLLEEGSTSRQALLLISGYVKITTRATKGDLLLTVRSEGDLVGDMAAISGRPRSATVTACTPVSAGSSCPTR